MKQPRTTAIYTEFGHVRPEVPEKFKVKGSKVKVTARRKSSKNLENFELENVSTANALQLEAGRRRSVPIRFYTSPVASFKSLSLSVVILERIYSLYVMTLNTYHVL